MLSGYIVKFLYNIFGKSGMNRIMKITVFSSLSALRPAAYLFNFFKSRQIKRKRKLRYCRGGAGAREADKLLVRHTLQQPVNRSRLKRIPRAESARDLYLIRLKLLYNAVPAVKQRS